MPRSRSQVAPELGTRVPNVEPAPVPPDNSQNWATPPEFIEAIARRFGRPDFDLAASPFNAKADDFLTEEDDALETCWLNVVKRDGFKPRVVFCNPPYRDIDPWVERLAGCRHLPRWTLMLVPASIDTDWYARHVEDKAFVMGLKGRIKFLGATSVYPKPLMLLAAGFSIRGGAWWDWRNQP